MATPPRQVTKNQLVDVTVKAVGESFRFLPTVDVRESLLFIFAWLVSKYGLLIHEYEFMSNHFHFVATDVRGELPNFMRDLDSYLAMQLNALRGTTGSNIEKGYSNIAISDPGKLLDKSVYVLCNAVSAHLVKRTKDWKGPNSLAMDYGVPVAIERPKCGIWTEKRAPKPKSPFASRGRRKYRGRSKAPQRVELTLHRPPEVLPELGDAELRQEIRNRVDAREAELVAERRRTGQKVLGMRGVLQQHFLDTPRRSRVLFETKPRVSGNDRRKRWEKLDARLTFEAQYRRSRDAWFEGNQDVVFPHGTWLMRVRFGAKCAEPPP